MCSSAILLSAPLTPQRWPWFWRLWLLCPYLFFKMFENHIWYLNLNCLVLLVLNLIKNYLTAYCLLGLFPPVTFQVVVCVPVEVASLWHAHTLFVHCAIDGSLGRWLSTFIRQCQIAFQKYLYHFTLLAIHKISTSSCIVLNTEYYQVSSFSSWMNVQWNLLLSFQILDCY